MIDSELPRNEDESESANFDKPIDRYEPEPNEELVGTFKPELTTGERRASTTYTSQYILLTDEDEPECYDEAIADEHKEKWLSAMQDEMESLHENYTYDLVELPKGKRALRNKWVYKVKTGEVDNTPRYKAHIVVKGLQQKKGVDFDEIFAPVMKMTSI